MALAGAIAIAAILASTASAHTLKAVRAANANKFVAREVCRGFVDDPDLGTCVDWSSGPCRRVSAHRIRCQMTHTFRLEDGSEGLCRQAQEWFVSDGEGELRARPVSNSASCREIKPPDPVVP